MDEPSARPRGWMQRLAWLWVLQRQAAADALLPEPTKWKRDAALMDAAALRLPEASMLIHWLRGVDPGHAEQAAKRHGGLRLAMAGLMALGAVLGVGAALALLAYDGSRPVNVLWLVAVFVGFEGLTVLATLGVMLRVRLAVVEDVQRLLLAMSPGRWLARKAAGQGLGRVNHWLTLLGAQTCAMMFNASALVTAALLLAFTDRAFGWSTTMDIETPAMARWLRVVALPWSWVSPSAVPSEALVAGSRAFRGQPFDPGALTGWWPFVLWLIAGYGLLPRVVLVAVARWRLGVALERAWRRGPAASAVLTRLGSQRVSTVAATPETQPDARAGSPVHRATPGPSVALVNWAQCPVSEKDMETALARPVVEQLEMAGRLTPQEDARVIEQLSRLPERATVVVAVRGWEPPMGELLDALRAIRLAVGDRGVQVWPVGASAASMGVWRTMLSTVGDGYLSVLDAGPEGGQRT